MIASTSRSGVALRGWTSADRFVSRRIGEGRKAIELVGALGNLVDQLVIQVALGRREALLADPSDVSIGVSEAEARAYERRQAAQGAAARRTIETRNLLVV